MNRLSATVGVVLLMHVLNATAQTFYVADRLQIGLHTQAKLDSTILELLPTGSELELIGRSGPLVKVRTSTGLEGWVDGNYISEEQPAQARVQSMEAELAGAQAKLGDAQAELAGAQAELADLQAKLVAIEQRPEQVATERAADESAKLPSEALREIQILAEENQRLKQQVAELEAAHRMARERADSAAADSEPSAAGVTPQPPAQADVYKQFIEIGMRKHWPLVLLASSLLLAFALGGWLVDWSARRRHGGFRV